MSRARSALRLRLTVASFLLSLLLVAGAVGALIVVLQHESDRTIATRLQERATALAATVTDRHGIVDVVGSDESLFDGPNWVFDPDGHRVEGPAAPGALGDAVTGLASATAAEQRQQGRWRLRAVPVRDRDRVVAVAVTGVDSAPYTASLQSVVRAAVLLGLLAVVGATALAALVLSRSLGPIAGMTEQAARWSRSDSHRRFGLGRPRDELSSLAAVLDDLLDRVDAALSAERRLTAEIAHELRTPLTLLAGEAQLALLDPDLQPAAQQRFERIDQAASRMAAAITVLLETAAAAAEGHASSDPAEAAAAVRVALIDPVPIRVEGRSSRVAVSGPQLERMLTPLIVNAQDAGAHAVRLLVSEDPAMVRIRVVDDGPGVAASMADGLFRPGASGRIGGTGLGLALARRLARDAGGDLRLVESLPATFELRLPRAKAEGGGPVKVR